MKLGIPVAECNYPEGAVILAGHFNHVDLKAVHQLPDQGQ